ncbi:MAG TPA: SRPBCC domain-containing protein [Bryobacteraceae bacterium]|nr:SRPBCC domain-containing protein [Bryobacteraceae bacterium]
MPEATKNRLTVTLPSDTEILMTREFDAPREMVFAAMTKPEHVSNWWGPRASKFDVCEIDFREGGSWRYTLDMLGQKVTFTGTFHKITPPEGLECTEVYNEPMFGNPQWKTILKLEDIGGGRTRMTSHVFHRSKDARDGHYNSGMEKGAAETFDRLEDLLAGRPAHAEPTGNPMEGEVEIVRVFDAPRDLVYEAWTKPEHMTQWWGPGPFTSHSCKLDVRPGGEWQITMRSPAGMDFRSSGVYSEVVPSERLVFTNDAYGQDGTLLLKGVTSVTFADEGRKTKLTVNAKVTGMVPYAPQMIKGMEPGWNMTLDKLAGFVTGKAATV